MNTFNDGIDMWLAQDPTRVWVIFAAWILAVIVAFVTLVRPGRNASVTGKALGLASWLFCMVVLTSFVLTFSRAAVSLWLPGLVMWVDWIPSFRWGHVLIIAILGAIAPLIRVVPTSRTRA